AVTGSDSNSANSNKTLTDKAVDTAVGESKIGIPECDEVMDLIQNELDNSDDNFIVKAGKATVLNRIKDGIREGVEKNKNSNSNKDLEETAKTCREFRKQFDKYKAEENAKHSQ
ncbi:MAG TPA: hypothetical protein VGQ55_11550, partial [Pyrinomonadaceae bacterium]|nr:hypothetical protein [Pyrinomonadaceae bacterium]